MRRDSNDKEWTRVKKEVSDRDKGVDRIWKCLNLKEALTLKKKGGVLLEKKDPAHIIAVSENENIMYEACNIVTLNRYSHEMLDSFRDPVDGHNITKREAVQWWLRILGTDKKQYNDFMELLKSKNITFGEE